MGLLFLFFIIISCAAINDTTCYSRGNKIIIDIDQKIFFILCFFFLYFCPCLEISIIIKEKKFSLLPKVRFIILQLHFLRRFLEMHRVY